jgi:hypothetical protein
VAQTRLQLKPRKHIRDNFKGWSQVSTHGLRINGKTLYELLLHDQEANQKGECPVMGCNYYRELRTHYGGTENPASKLVPSSPDLPVNDRLVKAIASLRSSHNSKAQLQEWFQTEPIAANERELCGILKAGLLQRPGASITQRELVLNIMSCFIKHSFYTSHPEFMGIAQIMWRSTQLLLKRLEA